MLHVPGGGHAKVPDVLLWSSMLQGPEAVMLKCPLCCCKCPEGAMLHLSCFGKCPEVAVLRGEGFVEVRTVVLPLGANNDREEGVMSASSSCPWTSCCKCPEGVVPQMPEGRVLTLPEAAVQSNVVSATFVQTNLLPATFVQTHVLPATLV